MRVTLAVVLTGWMALAAGATHANDWRVEIVQTPGPVKAVETIQGEPHILVGGGLFRIVARSNALTLAATARPLPRPRPAGFLPEGRIADGTRSLVRAWLADPTPRYQHGVLGDPHEAASLMLERRDRRIERIDAGDDAVFEDRQPRIVALDASGEHVLVVRSKLLEGASLAVIGERDGRYAVIAETPSAGAPKRWLNPAGVADFDGDGATDVALVRMPHVLGQLELWAWQAGALVKRQETGDVSNHVIGSRALQMAAVADFDGDGHPDLAIPSFDRRHLRVIAFHPALRDVARVTLPAPVVTELALARDGAGAPIVLAGLENGALVSVRRVPSRR